MYNPIPAVTIVFIGKLVYFYRMLSVTFNSEVAQWLKIIKLKLRENMCHQINSKSLLYSNLILLLKRTNEVPITFPK